VLTFLSKSYHLGSFNKKNAATWEYVAAPETIDKWTTLVTLIDRPDAHTPPELDRLAEGVMNTYKANNGRILLARTMQDKTGARFNYLVAAFDDPAHHSLELNFVKFAMGPQNAYIMVYGARVPDPSQGKEFLNQHSSEIGKALEIAVPPDFATLPRKEF
jgi:hypothetical protein